MADRGQHSPPLPLGVPQRPLDGQLGLQLPLRLENCLGLPRRARGEQHAAELRRPLRQGGLLTLDGLIAHGRADGPGESEARLQRQIGQHPIEVLCQFGQLGQTIMTRQHHLTAGVATGEQRHDKGVALLIAERPALHRLPLQTRHQSGHITAQLGQRQGTISLPGDGAIALGLVQQLGER